MSLRPRKRYCLAWWLAVIALFAVGTPGDAGGQQKSTAAASPVGTSPDVLDATDIGRIHESNIRMAD
jgi:hypothetical protein